MESYGRTGVAVMDGNPACFGGAIPARQESRDYRELMQTSREKAILFKSSRTDMLFLVPRFVN